MKSTLTFALASLTSLTGIALAQPVTSPSEIQPIEAGVLGVEILDAQNILVPREVRDAIGAELGVRITDAAAFAPGLGRLEIAIDGGVVRIAYHPAPGTVIERTLALPASAPDRLSLIAFVATNLVRDQATEVLSDLPALPPITPAPAPAVVRPQRFMPFTLGLVPPITIDRALGERVTVGFGVHAVMGVTDETAWASISGAGDIVTGTASGIQIGGAVASAGRVHYGAQIAGAVALSRGDLDGLQIGGAVTASLGHARGLQLGGAVALARGSLFGMQIGGGLAAAGGGSTGLQIAGGASFADRMNGAQIGGGGTFATHLRGMQIGGGANIAGRVEGLQLAGGLNIGGDVRGVQIGAVNIARKMRGVQIGAINLSDDGDDSYPIGVINYSRNGGVGIDAWLDSSRVSALAFRHGTKHIHNIWAIGWSPDHDNVLVGAGLGITRRIGDSLALDIDAMHWLTDLWDVEYGQINQLRANLAFPIAKNLELFAGVAANVYVSDTEDDSDNFHPVMARTYQPTDTTTVVLWPSAFAGVRLTAR